MKKGILGISASALVLQILSLLVFLVTVLAQRQIKHAMNYPPDIVAEFSIPCVQTVYLLLVTAAIAVVCISALGKGRSIWAEVAGIVMLTVVCALFYRLGTMIEQKLCAQFGSTYLAAHSTTLSITGIAQSISNLASSLALVACGMSIAAKKLAPKA